MTEGDVIAHAREHLAGYKIPRSVTWSDGAAQDRQRQDPQARAARPVLGRPGDPSVIAGQANSVNTASSACRPIAGIDVVSSPVR